jgi:uncharacterized protein (DUF305 family)
MTKAKFFNPCHAALLTLAMGLTVPLANAQPATGMGMGMGGMIDATGNPMPMMGKPMQQGMDMKPMMMDMNEKMLAMKPSGNTDTDFAMMMRVHHQAAITMAEAELQNGKDPQMRVMAKDIIYAQKKEIAAFDKFLSKRGQSGMNMKK